MKSRQLNAEQKCKLTAWLKGSEYFNVSHLPASVVSKHASEKLGFEVSPSSVLTIGQAMGVIKKRVKKLKELHPLNGAVMVVPELRERIEKLEEYSCRMNNIFSVAICELQKRVSEIAERVVKLEERK